jgi:hypothetical protein
MRMRCSAAAGCGTLHAYAVFRRGRLRNTAYACGVPPPPPAEHCMVCGVPTRARQNTAYYAMFCPGAPTASGMTVFSHMPPNHTCRQCDWLYQRRPAPNSLLAFAAVNSHMQTHRHPHALTSTLTHSPAHSLHLRFPSCLTLRFTALMHTDALSSAHVSASFIPVSRPQLMYTRSLRRPTPNGPATRLCVWYP